MFKQDITNPGDNKPSGVGRQNFDHGWTNNMGTDSEKCCSVVSANMRQSKHPTEQHAIEKSLLKQLKSETTLGIDGYAAIATSADLDKTIFSEGSLCGCSDFSEMADSAKTMEKRTRYSQTTSV